MKTLRTLDVLVLFVLNTFAFGQQRRSAMPFMDEFVNVKDFGATTGDTTNDTANINAALDTANSKGMTLLFPAGTYKVTPGLLKVIKCSVYGPNATIEAATDTNAPLIMVKYEESDNINAWHRFLLRRIIGYNKTNKIGQGLCIRVADYSEFNVMDIRYFDIGVHVDGETDNKHIASNNFNFVTFFENNTGIKLSSAKSANGTSAQCESNRFTINYMAHNFSQAIWLHVPSRNGDIYDDVDENFFDIMSLELNESNAHGIYVEQNANRNQFHVRSILGGDSGSGKLIHCAGTDNVFRIPNFNLNKITNIGNNIFDVRSHRLDTYGRSDVIGEVAPASGTWRQGDVCWRLGQIGGSYPGWVCVAGGSPGVWKAMANLAFSGNSTLIYVLGTDSKLWRERGSMYNRNQVDGNVGAFQAINDTLVYVLGTDGKLWRERGNMHNRDQVDGNVRAFQAMNGTLVYVLGTDSKLWRERGNMHNRDQVDGNVRTFQAMNETLVYVLGTDGKLWRELGDLNNRDLVDDNIQAFQAMNGTLVYVLSNDGTLWREWGNMKIRHKVDVNVRAFQAMNNTLVYVLDTNGNLWREQGDLNDRDWVDGSVQLFQAMGDGTTYALGTDRNLWRERVGWRNTGREWVDSNALAFQCFEN